jgi:hypothetical protein
VYIPTPVILTLARDGWVGWFGHQVGDPRFGSAPGCVVLLSGVAPTTTAFTAMYNGSVLVG